MPLSKNYFTLNTLDKRNPIFKLITKCKSYMVFNNWSFDIELFLCEEENKKATIFYDSRAYWIMFNECLNKDWFAFNFFKLANEAI